MRNLPAILLFILVTGSAIAQPANNIKGRIVNAETGAAIPNASVFITNTSKGTVSNGTGEFELLNVPEGTYDLIISCIGYETQVYTYKASQLPLKLRVQMTAKAEELQTIIVEPYEKDGWEKWGTFFMGNFIGTSGNAKNCTIKNYTTLRFRNSKKKNQLTVTADEPLIIENKALGYKIQYQLEGFSYNFKENILLYFGYTLFDELNRKKGPKQWQLKNREKAYHGSIMHFMGSLYNNRLSEEGFEVRRLVKTPNLEKQRVKKIYLQPFSAKQPKDSIAWYESILRQPDMLEEYGKSLLIADSLITKMENGDKRLFFNDYLYVVYKKEKEDDEYLHYIHENRQPFYQRSVVFLPNKNALLVDAMGNYSMPQDFMSYDYWSWSEKIATMLPLDYKSISSQ